MASLEHLKQRLPGRARDLTINLAVIAGATARSPQQGPAATAA